MQLPVVHLTVVYVLVHVNAVPHRNYSPLSRDPFRASAWNRVQEKPSIRESPRNVTSQSSGNDGIVAVRSSTERGSKVRTFANSVNRVYTPRLWRPKTVTKKMDRRPRLVRKYPSPLISGQRQLPQLPKCHMPWINELSKIQFYWDGINALCDIAMTFESCTTSGSICRRYPVEFTCCPATSLPVLEKCYKGQQTPENVCLPTTVQMSGMSMASRFTNRQSRPNRPSRPVQSFKPALPRGRIERVITEPQYPVNQVRIAGCSPECSPAWVNMFANIKPVQNESLPVCEFPDVFQSCLSPGYKCAKHPVDSTCCPLRCIPELEKCYTENPPESVCTPRSLTPWIRRIRKYFG